MVEVGYPGVGVDEMLIDPAVSVLAVHMPIKLLYLYQIERYEHHLVVVFK
jgi:hypothetical protein